MCRDYCYRPNTLTETALESRSLLCQNRLRYFRTDCLRTQPNPPKPTIKVRRRNASSRGAQARDVGGPGRRRRWQGNGWQNCDETASGLAGVQHCLSGHLQTTVSVTPRRIQVSLLTSDSRYSWLYMYSWTLTRSGQAPSYTWLTTVASSPAMTALGGNSFGSCQSEADQLRRQSLQYNCISCLELSPVGPHTAQRERLGTPFHIFKVFKNAHELACSTCIMDGIANHFPAKNATRLQDFAYMQSQTFSGVIPPVPRRIVPGALTQKPILAWLASVRIVPVLHLSDHSRTAGLGHTAISDSRQTFLFGRLRPACCVNPPVNCALVILLRIYGLDIVRCCVRHCYFAAVFSFPFACLFN